MNTPWRFPILAMLVMALSLALAACGGGGGGGDDVESDLPERAEATSEDAEGTTYPLQAGRYRLSYRAPGCEDVEISVTSADGAFTYEQQPRGFTSFINDMVDGEYTIGVISDCDEWTVTLIKF